MCDIELGILSIWLPICDTLFLRQMACGLHLGLSEIPGNDLSSSSRYYNL